VPSLTLGRSNIVIVAEEEEKEQEEIATTARFEKILCSKRFIWALLIFLLLFEKKVKIFLPSIAQHAHN
jgi:hypothetical protein